MSGRASSTATYTRGETMNRFRTVGSTVAAYACLPVALVALPFLQYDLKSDHTLGGFKNKWLLAGNRKLEKVLTRNMRR